MLPSGKVAGNATTKVLVMKSGVGISASTSRVAVHESFGIVKFSENLKNNLQKTSGCQSKWMEPATMNKPTCDTAPEPEQGDGFVCDVPRKTSAAARVTLDNEHDGIFWHEKKHANLLNTGRTNGTRLKPLSELSVARGAVGLCVTDPSVLSSLKII